jgi:hypothetical protein
VLCRDNPYSHCSLDGLGASKTCRGKLFFGIEEEWPIFSVERSELASNIIHLTRLNYDRMNGNTSVSGHAVREYGSDVVVRSIKKNGIQSGVGMLPRPFWLC